MRGTGKREGGRGKGGFGRGVLAGALMLGALMLAVPSEVGAQERYVELAQRYDRARLYHEAFAVPGASRPALVVSFRIPNAMLVFVQARPGETGGAFVAEAEVAVAVYRGEALVEEKRWRATQHAADFEATQSRTSDVEGLVTFALAPGLYTYRLTIQDGNSERSRELKRYPVEVPDFGVGGVGGPVVAWDVHVAGPDVRLSLVNLGGDVPFGRTSEVAVPLSLPPDVRPGAATLTYALYEREEEDGRPGEAAPVRRTRDGTVLPPLEVVRQGAVVATGTVEGAALAPVAALDASEQEGGALAWPAASAPVGYFARIPLGGERLTEGAYVLEAVLHVGDAESEPVARRRAPFDVRWHGKPVSLYSPAVAIRNLQFIEARAVVREMLKGGRSAQQAKLDAYWEARDPTPETRANELMAEYYRRVDHAADAFRTGTVPAPDGLATDRARVYVVHGPPRTVRRTFPSPGGVEETWTYADGRQFVFRAATSFDAFELARSE